MVARWGRPRRSGRAPWGPHSRCPCSRAFSGPTAWSPSGPSAAAAMMLFGFARQPMTAFVASLIAGISWIVVLATINVSTEVSLPGWARGRGLSICGAVMFGALTLGSAVWGEVAALSVIPAAHVIAALGALIAVPLLWRWKLDTGADLDIAPSLHWPDPSCQPMSMPIGDRCG
jgi:Transmembrane secretion effector